MNEVVARENAMAQQQEQQQQQQQHQQQHSQIDNSMGTSDARQQRQPPTTYMVTVPHGVFPGMQFAVDVEGERMSELHNINFCGFVCRDT